MAQTQAQPYNKGDAISKSDTINFDGSTYSANPTGGYKPSPCEAIYVGGAGVMVVVFESGLTASFTCIAGQILPVKAIRVNSTNTTATLMIALYTV
jgi:hypothetical protein